MLMLSSLVFHLIAIIMMMKLTWTTHTQK